MLQFWHIGLIVLRRWRSRLDRCDVGKPDGGSRENSKREDGGKANLCPTPGNLPWHVLGTIHMPGHGL